MSIFRSAWLDTFWTVLIYLFISLWTAGYLFYSLAYNPILLYLFCYSNRPTFGYWLTPVCFLYKKLSIWFYFLSTSLHILILQDAPDSSNIYLPQFWMKRFFLGDPWLLLLKNEIENHDLKLAMLIANEWIVVVFKSSQHAEKENV